MIWYDFGSIFGSIHYACPPEVGDGGFFCSNVHLRQGCAPGGAERFVGRARNKGRPQGWSADTPKCGQELKAVCFSTNKLLGSLVCSLQLAHSCWLIILCLFLCLNWSWRLGLKSRSCVPIRTAGGTTGCGARIIAARWCAAAAPCTMACGISCRSMDVAGRFARGYKRPVDGTVGLAKSCDAGSHENFLLLCLRRGLMRWQVQCIQAVLMWMAMIPLPQEILEPLSDEVRWPKKGDAADAISTPWSCARSATFKWRQTWGNLKETRLRGRES